MTAFPAGFALSLSLILAIGAQNAFVLRQGLRRAHVFAICLTCALSDMILIAAGVAGFGVVIEAAPWIAPVLTWVGALFLIVYGAMAFQSAWRGSAAQSVEGAERQSLASALLTCLALTWLNPHVYLDTVILLGAVASRYDPRWAFAAGATLASFLYFFALGYGARVFAPLFARTVAWRILDLVVGATMWALAIMLVWP